jgi:predicted lipid-binding transport protein (Tim44 family)
VRRATLLTLAVVLTAAQSAYAGPGGGTSGFGGGGGGGGGGFSGGGGSGGAGSGGDGTSFLVFVGLVLAFFLVTSLLGALQVRRMRRRRAQRERRVVLAAAEAADDDAAFDAESVKAAAKRLYEDLVNAWTARDRRAMEAMIGPDLLVEWDRRLRDFDAKGWHNICTVIEGPKVEYLGLVNRADDSDDRVTVRIEARQRDIVKDQNGNVITRKGSQSDTVAVAEYWTLGKRDGHWILLSIEQDAEGAHHLDAEIVATPWGDETRLHDESVTELATAEALPEQQIAEVADLDFDGTARAAALDLAMVDGRFAPDVLEAAARRAVAAWAESVDGDDAALKQVASPQAVHELLYGGDVLERTRLVVRGPRLTALRITALHPDAKPPTMEVEADITGRRYRENRDTAAVVQGSKERETSFTERWTMALDGDETTPWRIADTGMTTPT